MIGRTISHYKILEKIGEGGMGVVYKAQDTKLDRTVALKFLPPHLSINKEEKKRFIHEAKAAAALDHTNICAVYEIDETEDGQMFIAMACYEGETLKEKVEKGPLKLDEAINIAIQVAQGLQRAHESHIVHRDIKSANIIVTKRNDVKILDFGLAKLRGVTKLTKAGTTVGTVAYMSPEQASGDKVDHRSDIWSLGILLYEMITGQLPFKGDYEQAVVYAILNEEPEPVTGLRTGIPPELERIINKALEKDPSDRYQHADDMMVDLRKLKKDSKSEVIVTKKKTSPEITLKTSRKMLVLGGVFLAAIILVAGFIIFKGKAVSKSSLIEPGGNPSIVIPYLENRTGDKNMDLTCESIAELMTTDLLQSKHLNVVTSGRIYGALKKLKLLNKRRYSFEDLKNLSLYLGTHYIISGQLFKMGNVFTISIVILKADTGEVIKPITEKANNESEFNPRIDEISKKIKLAFLSQKEIKDDYDKRVSDITSDNPEALKYYLQGIKALYKEDRVQAKKLFEKAIELDPDFAIAWKKLAFCAGGANFWKFFLKAFELSKKEKLSTRERLQIQSQYYYLSGLRGHGNQNIEKGRRLNEELLELYPQDGWGNWALGFYWYHLWLADVENAVKYSKLAAQAEPGDVTYINHVSWSYQRMGLYMKAINICRNYIKKYSEVLNLNWALVQIYIAMGNFDRALEEADKGLAMEDTGYVYKDLKIQKGNINYLRGDYVTAEKQFRGNGAKNQIALLYYTQGKLNKVKKLFEEDKPKKSFLNRDLAILYFYGFKNIDAALSELKKESPPPPYMNYKRAELMDNSTALIIKGLAYLQKNSIPQAVQVAGELKYLLNKFFEKSRMGLYFNLMGEIELARANYSKAIKYSNQALSLENHGLQRSAWHVDSLALAYSKSGDLEKAIIGYEDIGTLTLGRLARDNGPEVGLVYAKSFYHLGKLYQEKGWKGKAIDSYNKFIDLWKDCDPPLKSMVEDARKRVKELEANK